MSKAFHKLGNWIKANWRSIVTIVVVAVLTWGLGTFAAVGPVGTGAISGGVSGGLNAGLNGVSGHWALMLLFPQRIVDKIEGFDHFVGMNRLTIEIEPEQHRQIKTLATFAGMTMKEFILSQVLPPKKPVEKSAEKMDTSQKLLSHPKNKSRLLAAIKTPREDHIVFETIDELKDALGI